MSPPQLPPYRACLWYGAAYTSVFVLVAVGRLLLMEDISVSRMDAAALIPGLFFAYAAGCVFALPLVWTLRRFRMNSRVPIALWFVAVPFSALGSVFGGLLGPPGILLLGGTPILAALGMAFVVQAVWTRFRPGEAGG